MRSAVATLERDIEAALSTERPRLFAHCYRLLGSPVDAEEFVQTALVRAWEARGSFDGRCAPGTWLHAIATRCCLDELRKRPRRAIPAGLGLAPDAQGPWIVPLVAPDSGYERHESISLAFLALLQRLPPRQRAALVLTDVLDWSASEIAALLDTTVPAVRSALVRARATLRSATAPHQAPPNEAVSALAAQMVAAWERADIDGLAALLADDVVLSMPPEGLWIAGRASVAAFFAATVWPERRWQLVPARANGTLALATWMGRLDEPLHAHALQVIHLDEASAIRSIVSFRDPSVLLLAGLPEIF